MTRITIPWHRILPRHQRLVVWWIVAGIGIAAPWMIGGVDLPWAQHTAVSNGCKVASIYDGDTLRAECSGGLKVKVRFYCIDTPEMQQKPWGTESRDYLRRIAPKVVTLQVHDTDRYGRQVAEVIDPATGEALNLAMVKAGQAAVYRRYCSDPRYSRAEAAAKAAGLGIWAKPGDHQRPWAWRKR